MSKKQVILTGAVAALASVALQGSAMAATTGVASPVVQSAKLSLVDAQCGCCQSADGCAACGCCESLGCGECGSCEEGCGADSN